MWVAVVLATLVVSLIGVCGPMTGHRSVVPEAAGSAATAVESVPRTTLVPAADEGVSPDIANPDHDRTGEAAPRADESLPAVTAVRGTPPQRCGGPAIHVDADVSATASVPRGDLVVTALRAAIAAPFGLPPALVEVHVSDQEPPPTAPHLSTVLRI